MASHKDLANADLHEPKGISAASDNEVATSTSNAIVWKKLSAANFTSTNTAATGQIFISNGAGSGTWTDSSAVVAAQEYATIYTADGSTASGAITTPVILGIATDGASNGAVPDAANNRITLTNAGDYFVSFNISYIGSASNSVWAFHARLDGVETYLGIHRKIGTGADVGACSFSGALTATAGQQLSVYAESASSSTITISDAQLTANLLMKA